MTEVVDWAEQFGKDWWNDITTEPIYTEIRNC